MQLNVGEGGQVDVLFRMSSTCCAHEVLRTCEWKDLDLVALRLADKCTHEHAKSAFEVVNSANKQLADETIKRELVHVLNLARGARWTAARDCTLLPRPQCTAAGERVCCGAHRSLSRRRSASLPLGAGEEGRWPGPSRSPSINAISR